MDYSSFIGSFGKIDRANNGSITSNELLWQVSAQCVSSLGVLDFIIYLFDQKSGKLSQEAGFGLKASSENVLINPLNVNIGKGIVGDSAQKMTYQLVSNTRSDIRYIVDGSFNDSELSVPIIWEGKLLGVLDSEHPTRNYFGDRHIDAFYTIASFLGPRLASVKKTKRKFSKQNKYYCQFIELMEKELLYKKEDLTLDTIASMLNINKCYLSKIINQVSSKKITSIVNAYRVEEVKNAILKGKHKHFTIISLAYEAGFTSKASFNSSFRKETGMTPTNYIGQLV